MHSPHAVSAEPNDTVDFGALLAALKRHAATIVLCTLLAASASLAHALYAIPQFTAQGVLYLGETQSGDDGGDSSGTLNLSAYSTQSDVETQLGLLTAGTLIARAELETGLNTALRPAGQPPLTYLRWRVFAHGDTAAFIPGPNSLQAVNATLSGQFRLVVGANNTYRLYARGKSAAAHVLILSGVIGVPATSGAYAITIQYAQPANSPQNGVIPPAQAAVMPVGASFDLDVTPPDLLADGLSGGGLAVTAGGSPEQPTKLATLQLRWPDPYQAQQFINQLMYDYIATQLQWKTEAASVTENFVTGQIADVGKKLAKSDAALAAFQAQTNIVDPQQNAQEAVGQLAAYQSQRGTLLLQQEALQQLSDSLHNNSYSVNPYLVSATDDTVLAGLASSLSAALVKMAELNADYMPDSQDIYVQQSQVDQLRAAIRSLVANDLGQATKNLANLDQLIASYQTNLKAQPAEALKVAALKRDSDQLGQFYGILTQKAEQAQISKAATIIDTRVVAPARLARLPTTPKPKMAAIAGALAGLFAGVIIVFLQHTLSGSYDSEAAIRRSVRLPVLGAVPTRKSIAGGSKFFGPETPNAFSESFRLIRRNLAPWIRRDKATVILVISANEGDGKTTVAANLAKAFADEGKRAVMLDCDPYLSRLSMPAEVDAAPEDADGNPMGQAEPRCWPGESFWLIPAGALPTRRGRLDEAAFFTLTNRLMEKFDYIILDAPPLPVASDGLALGRWADVILSVVSIRHTERRSLDYHNELIAGLGRPHGIVINGAIGANYAQTDAYFRGTGPKHRRARALRRRKAYAFADVATDE